MTMAETLEKAVHVLNLMAADLIEQQERGSDEKCLSECDTGNMQIQRNKAEAK